MVQIADREPRSGVNDMGCFARPGFEHEVDALHIYASELQ